MVYWPELMKFCGRCKLNTGIYVVGILQTIANIVLAVADTLNVIDLIHQKQRIFGFGVPDFETARKFHNDQIDQVFPISQEEVMILLQLYKVFLTQRLVWLLCRCSLILSVFVLFYGIHKCKPSLIKVFLFINFPGWILVTLNSAIEMIGSYNVQRSIVVIFTLLSAYQMLAARSAYRILTGKTKFYVGADDNIEPSNETGDPPPYLPQFSMTVPNNAHCITCSCDGNRSNQNNSPTIQSCNIETRDDDVLDQNATTDSNSDLDNCKEENLKEEPIVFDQNQLVRHHPILEEQGISLDDFTNGSNAVNSMVETIPSSIIVINGNNCSNNMIEKTQLDDVPVIYDKEQLNFSGNPIFESR